MTTTHQQEAQAMRAELSRSRTDAEAAVDGAAERIVTRPAPSTHTPGPWVAEQCGRYKRGHMIFSGDSARRKRVGYSYTDVRTMHVGEEEANARLIAAAPDLYAALNAMVEADDAHWPLDTALAIRNAARAALAKASPR